MDDDEAVTTTVKVVLMRAGHSVDALHNGQETLAKLKESPDFYQVLIADPVMPEMTGLQLLQQLKATAFRGKVIVLSAHLTKELEAQYRAAGADLIIQKPFELDELRRAVGGLGQ